MIQNVAGRRLISSVGVAFSLGFALVGMSSTHAIAQADAPADNAGPPPAPKGTTPTVTGDPQVSPPRKTAEAAKPTEFIDAGKAIATATIKLPAGADAVRQLTAPLGNGIDNVLLNVYKLSGGLFVDVFTSHKNQAWSKRNHIHLQGPLALRPEKMETTMRFLDLLHHKGFLIVASDESADVTMAFPNGFGGKVFQQQFLAQSKTGAHHSYTFGDQDSRGFTIVKASLDSAGEVKPAEDTQFYVWNGRMFIPRKDN